MVLCKLQFAAWIRILVPATSHHEQSSHAWMIGFQILLSVPRVVAVPLEETHRRVVAGVSENDRLQFSIGMRVPLYCTASGKLYLSSQPKSRRKSVIGKLELYVGLSCRHTILVMLTFSAQSE